FSNIIIFSTGGTKPRGKSCPCCNFLDCYVVDYRTDPDSGHIASAYHLTSDSESSGWYIGCIILCKRYHLFISRWILYRNGNGKVESPPTYCFGDYFRHWRDPTANCIRVYGSNSFSVHVGFEHSGDNDVNPDGAGNCASGVGFS